MLGVSWLSASFSVEEKKREDVRCLRERWMMLLLLLLLLSLLKESLLSLCSVSESKNEILCLYSATVLGDEDIKEDSEFEAKDSDISLLSKSLVCLCWGDNWEISLKNSNAKL